MSIPCKCRRGGKLRGLRGASVAKKAERIGAKKKVHRVEREGKPAVPRVFTDLSDAEKDLVSHMEQGWRLEAGSLGGNPVLHDPKSDEVIRAMSANRSTLEAHG